MKYYSVAELEITDPSWVRDYVENVTTIAKSTDHTGKAASTAPKPNSCW